MASFKFVCLNTSISAQCLFSFWKNLGIYLNSESPFLMVQSDSFLFCLSPYNVLGVHKNELLFDEIIFLSANMRTKFLSGRIPANISIDFAAMGDI
ncbi:hypothetical protein LENED_006435 [Lentinula edodes]|uniref:Uncharacterized protein n=1 Tax=Lentinula edodes TaxID=5353 RepID=A0A1Q3EBN8_LENED|nr:hypothetical protein LENED_006435 [Lentinula edodes]